MGDNLKKFFIVLFSIFVLLSIYGFIPRKTQSENPRQERVLINPLLQGVPDTLKLESPDWVKPCFIEHTVTVTVYHAVRSQTDKTPNILADGTRIDPTKAGEYRYCALSRNLLERWGGPYAYGDTIYLEDAGEFSGPWIVKDTMNSRFTDRMDLLVDRHIVTKFEVAVIWKEI